MRRRTFVGGLLASTLVLGYGGWLSSANSSSGEGGSSQTGKPGEAPKESEGFTEDHAGKPGGTK